MTWISLFQPKALYTAKEIESVLKGPSQKAIRGRLGKSDGTKLVGNRKINVWLGWRVSLIYQNLDADSLNEIESLISSEDPFFSRWERAVEQHRKANWTVIFKDLEPQGRFPVKVLLGIARAQGFFVNDNQVRNRINRGLCGLGFMKTYDGQDGTNYYLGWKLRLLWSDVSPEMVKELLPYFPETESSAISTVRDHFNIPQYDLSAETKEPEQKSTHQESGTRNHSLWKWLVPAIAGLAIILVIFSGTKDLAKSTQKTDDRKVIIKDTNEGTFPHLVTSDGSMVGQH